MWKSLTSVRENDIDSNYQTNEGGGLKKIFLTLQYYKFLFYSMKTEWKFYDFVKLIRVYQIMVKYQYGQ